MSEYPVPDLSESLPESSDLAVLTSAVRALWADGMTIRDAVGRVLATVGLDPEQERYFATIGLIFFCNQKLTAGRKSGDWSFHSRFSARGPNAKEIRGTILARLALQGADGAMKSILEFDLADVDYFAALSKSHMDGWKSRHGAMRGIRRLMDEHKVTKVSDLPLDALAEASRWVSEAWS